VHIETGEGFLDDVEADDVEALLQQVPGDVAAHVPEADLAHRDV
jgi:hypothetical protein